MPKIPTAWPKDPRMKARHPSLLPSVKLLADIGQQGTGVDSSATEAHLDATTPLSGPDEKMGSWLSGDTRLTADNVVVVTAPGQSRHGWRRKPIDSINSASLPHPRLEALYRSAVPGLFLHTDSEKTFSATIQIVDDSDAYETTWIASTSLELLERWRGQTKIKLFHRARLHNLERGAEHHAARLSHNGIDGVELYCDDWNGGLVTLFHRFGVLGVSSGNNHHREMAQAIDAGIDAIRTPHIDRLRSVHQQFEPRSNH